MMALAWPDNMIAFPEPQGKSNEWYTPARYIEAAREVMGSIDLDPASCEVANRTVKAARFYSQEENGLTQPWYGNVWLNPPYGRVNPELKGSTKSIQVNFSRRLLQEYKEKRVQQAIALMFGTSCCMPWFMPFWEFPLCLMNKRINFIKPDGTEDHFGYGNVIVYLGTNEQKFIEVFSQFGRIAKAIDTPRQTIAAPSLWEVQP